MFELFIFVADRYGLHVLGLMAVAFALWRSARWFAVKVAEPIIAAHVGLVQDTRENGATNASALGAQTEILKDIRHTLREQIGLLRDIKEDRDNEARRRDDCERGHPFV